MSNVNNLNGRRKKSIVRTMIRILILLPLLLSAFLLYSVLKIRATSSVPIAVQPQAGEMLLYGHAEHLSVKIGSRSVYEDDKLTAAKEYIFSSLEAMGHTPMLQDYSPTTIHKVQAPMQPVSVSDERDKPDGSSSVSMRQAQ